MIICRKTKMQNIILGAVSVIILLMGLCLPVNAQESVKVYNRNEEVSLLHGLFMHNERNYIHIDDLSQLGLDVMKENRKYNITSNDALGVEGKLVIEIGPGEIGGITPVYGELEDITPTIKPTENIIPGEFFIPSIDLLSTDDLLSTESVTVDEVSWRVSYSSRSTGTIGYTQESTRGYLITDYIIGNEFFYEDTDDMIKVNGEYYISSEFIGEKLSHKYLEESGRIDFYIADSDGVLTETTVNLVKGAVAATGGHSVEIYTAYKTGEGNTIDDFEILSEVNCIIPENESSVGCLIETSAERINDSNIYVIVDFGERYLLSYDEFNFSKVGNVKVYGEQKDVTYTSKINLPEIDECDVPFTVYAVVDGSTYSKQGIVKSGEKSATIELSGLPKSTTYKIRIEFDYHKYKNAVIANGWFLNSVYARDFKTDFTAEYSRKVVCTVSLPDDFIADRDVEVKLELSKYIKSGSVFLVDQLRDWKDTKTIILNKENPSQQVCLYSQASSSMLSYKLTADVDGLYKIGYLRTDGKVTSDYELNKEITEDSVVDIQLLKRKNIKVNVIRPTSLSVENDIFASVELDDESTILYADKTVDFTETPLIPSGEMLSTFEFELVEDKTYTLKIANITGDDRLFDYCCYVSYPATNAEEDKKRQITFNDDAINLTLLRCNNITGMVKCEKSDLNFTVIAYCNLYNGRTVKFKSTKESGEFSFKIPDDVNSYSLAVYTGVGKNSYYVSDGISTNYENKATEIPFVYGDDREVVLEYILQNPSLPVEFSFDEEFNWFRFINISDYLIEADVFVAYYDKHGRLISVEKTENDKLRSGSNYYIPINTSNYKINKVKAFAWKKGELVPLSNIFTERVNTPNLPEQNMSVFKVGDINAVINCDDVVLNDAPEVIEEILYISKADFEKLGYEVFVDGTEVYIQNDEWFFEFTIGEYTALEPNDNIKYEISAPILKNDGVMIPLGAVCELFGNSADWYRDAQVITLNVPFTDVQFLDMYSTAILDMYYKGVVNGYEDRTFHPQENVIRSEAATYFSRAMGYEFYTYEFECSDVAEDHWAKSFIGICINEGLFELENGKFRPDDYITVEETVIAALKMRGINTDNYMETAKASGLLTFINEENIERNITRAELTQLIYNVSK